MADHDTERANVAAGGDSGTENDDGFTPEPAGAVRFGFEPNDSSSDGNPAGGGNDHSGPDFRGPGGIDGIRREPRDTGGEHDDGTGGEDTPEGFSQTVPPHLKGPARPNVDIQAWSGLWQVIFGVISTRRGQHWLLAPEEASALGDVTVRTLKSSAKWLPKRYVGVVTKGASPVAALAAVFGTRIYTDYALRQQARQPGYEQRNGAGTPSQAAALAEFERQNRMHGAI